MQKARYKKPGTLRDAILHGNFEIGGGGGLSTKNNALCVHFYKQKTIHFPLHFYIQKARHFGSHFHMQKTMHFPLRFYI